MITPLHASYQTDYLKLKVCEELRVNMRDMPVEACFKGRFKFTQRGDVRDFRWSLKKNGEVCTGSIYDDQTIHVDGCFQ